jgi:tight adherence protein C
MIDALIATMSDTRFLAMMFAAIAAAATVITLAMPLFVGDNLGRRMKAVALEREKIRQRERERMVAGQKVSLRRSPKQYMKTIMLITAVIYLFVIVNLEQPAMIKVGLCIGAAYLGMHLPYLFLKNKITRRQTSIRRAFPDALDLLLICIESGMSVEAAFRKVSQEIGTQSIALAEEFTLTTAELSYLPDRRQAYENLAKRTDLEGVKAVCVALQQAERYGTPLGTALRVMAQENRDMRMAEAEKKAAALPPKLTVPMILFFLPCLFIVILGPAAIKVMAIR